MIRKFYNAGAGEGTGGMTLQQQIQGLIKATADGMELKTKEQLQSIVLSVETINQQLSNMASKKDVELVGQLKKDIEEINKNIKDNQEVIDKFVAEEGKRKGVEKKSFDDGWHEKISAEVESKAAEIKNFQTDRNAKIEFKLDLKTMTLSSVTGDVVQGYNSRQGIVPSQKRNFRELIPTTQSPTGSYVTYRETNSVQAIGIQTEGSTKTNVDYAFTEVKSVSKYIAGKTTFSKQLMFALPFLQTTLPRVLIRDFYKKENDYFYSTAAAAATGSDYVAGATVDAEELLYLIANQLDAEFDPSYLLVRARQWARILATKPQDYSVPGGIVISPTGDVMFAGVPLIPASWASHDKVLLFDRDFMERVETESLRVEFSYENNDNFEKNMVTARVECFEELNILRPDSVIYHDMGNS